MSNPHIRTTFLAPAKVIMLEPFKGMEDEGLDLACIIRLYPREFFLNHIYLSKMPSETVGL